MTGGCAGGLPAQALHLRSTNLDGTPGQSGSGWLKAERDGWYVLGAFSQNPCPPLGGPFNQARRIDAAVANFIEANSPDF